MRQQVNLYTAEFRRGDQPLSSRWLLVATAGFVLLLALIQLGAYWQLSATRAQLAVAEQEQQQVSARLEQLRASRPLGQRERLEQQLSSLRAEVQRREELRSLIGGQKLGNASGFSPYLEAMARQSNTDISLTQFRLLGGGDYLELAGWTRRPDAVPLYLQQLRDESSFRKVKFGTLGIREDAEHSHKLRFSLGKPEGGSS